MIVQKFYAPEGTFESFDTVTNTFFDGYGNDLPDFYLCDDIGEGESPFGDE